MKVNIHKLLLASQTFGQVQLGRLGRGHVGAAVRWRSRSYPKAMKALWRRRSRVAECLQSKCRQSREPRASRERQTVAPLACGSTAGITASSLQVPDKASLEIALNW